MSFQATITANLSNTPTTTPIQINRIRVVSRAAHTSSSWEDYTAYRIVTA